MKYIYYLLLVILGCSCYDDKGNYNYEEINEINIRLEKLYVVTSLYTDIKIVPEYSQTLRENHDNLTFRWEELSGEFLSQSTDTLGITSELELNINADEPGFKYVRYLRLVVEDNVSGLRYIADTKLQVAKPFYKSWMILHEENGVAQLAAVEYLGGEVRYRKDAYGEESGKSFAGKPVALGVFDHFETDYYDAGANKNYVSNGFAIVTDRAVESGVYCQWNGFRQMASFDKMVYPADAGGFNVAKVSFLGGGTSSIQLCVSGGKLFQSLYSGKFYKAHVHSEVAGEIDITLVGKEGNCPMFYDQTGKRFLWYRNSEWNLTTPYPQFDPAKENPEKAMVRLVPFRVENVTEVDPSNLRKEQKMLYMGQGYAESMYDHLMYAVGLGADKCYVYEFKNGNPFLYDRYGASFNAYYEKDIPEGLTEESCLTSSRTYNGIFFYTSNNVVYRYDYNTGNYREIYRHEGAVKATYANFAKKQKTYLEDDPFMGNNYPMWQQMGIVFQMLDGSYEFVVLQLDGTGKVDAGGSSLYPSVQVYRGLGKVADVVFV